MPKKPNAPARLTDTMILVLADLQAHEGAWFASEIAERIGSTARAVNPVLTSLCGEGRGCLLEKEDAEEEVIDTKTGKPKVVTHKKYWLSEAGKKINIEEL